MANLQENEITFPIGGGIFGVGQLATNLKALTAAGTIGPWHIGHWIDFRHTAIRIQFASSADGELARSFVENWHRAHAPDGRYVQSDARVADRTLGASLKRWFTSAVTIAAMTFAAAIALFPFSMNGDPSNRIVRGLRGL